MSVPTSLKHYLGDFQTTGDIKTDVKKLLLQYGHEHTYHHVKSVAVEAGELARQFGGEVEPSEDAAWLHDISTVVPNEERIALAEALGTEVLPEERQFPMIIHQKLSVVFAEAVFGATDPAVLSAIGCHTTLKAGASLTDKIVFVADKVAWDQPAMPPYQKALNEGLEHSIDAAALAYLDYLWHRRKELRVLPPWVSEARADLLA